MRGLRQSGCAGHVLLFHTLNALAPARAVCNAQQKNVIASSVQVGGGPSRIHRVRPNNKKVCNAEGAAQRRAQPVLHNIETQEVKWEET